jgi:hypothetical protein
MPPFLRLVLRAVLYMVVGGVLLGTLGLAMYLPSMLDASTTDAPVRATSALDSRIGLGVALACARLGAVVGFITFLLRRSLSGEIADPRAVATRVHGADAP